MCNSRDYIGEIVEDATVICCACGDLEHNMIYRVDRDEPEVWLYFTLNKESFFKRLILGIKYIFGYQSRYGMYGEILVDKNNVNHFKKIYDHVKNFKK